MSSPVSSTSSNRAGLCPHGLPPAACPICSGGAKAGGAGARETKAMTKPVKSGEWSYMKCVAVGLQMKAQQARTETAKQAFERQIEFAKQLGKSIDNLAEKIKNNLQNIQNSLPNALRAPMQAVVNFIINPVLNLISQIPQLIEKFAHLQKDIREFIQQAAEKLVTILGEVKNFIEKKITEKLKKKIKSFFSFLISEFDDENYTNDDTLAVFKSRELKKYLYKILKIEKKRDGNDNRRT